MHGQEHVGNHEAGRSTEGQGREGTGTGWHARMIGPECDGGVGTQASFVSTVFTLEQRPEQASMLITALGLYICFINGRRVGRDLLTPGWTCYDARLSYQTYDVSDYLAEGANHIEIWLADGWMRSQMLKKPAGFQNVWGSEIGALVQMVDGDGALLLASDASWRSGLLPILKSGIYFGEIYDARIRPEISAGCRELDFDFGRLVAHEIEPVRELPPIPLKAQWTDRRGRRIYDFGQNSAGYLRFSVRGEPGARLVFEHGEVLDEAGEFYGENYRTAESRVEYVCAGGEQGVYAPHFTFHGFRYACLTILGEAEILSIESVPISSVTEPAGAFSSGHPLVNRLVENTLWSQRANFIEVPTDCPQRDERLGWTGDAQIFAATACYFHDCEAFFSKYLRDVMVDQRPDGAIPHVCPDPTRLVPNPDYRVFHGSTGWGDVITVVPWTLYRHYGNTAILAECLPAMARWVDFVWSISDGPIVCPPRQRNRRGFTFGDWLQPRGPSNKPWPTIGDDAAATIYLYVSADLTARAAAVVGDTDIAARYRGRAEAVKAAFEREFITPSGRLIYDDQTSYALAFLFDLIPDRHRDAARRYFANVIERTEGKIGTGFIGTPALLPALCKVGLHELAARVFLQEEVPGWLFQVRNGATTIWERWDSLREDGSINRENMNSYNHYAYGAVCQWLFEHVGGIRPCEDEPGFRRIEFSPFVIPELSPVSADHQTRGGRIASSWIVTGSDVVYRFTVPEGSTGTLKLLSRYGSPTLDGQPLGLAASPDRLPPGDYVVTFSLPDASPVDRADALPVPA